MSYQSPKWSYDPCKFDIANILTCHLLRRWKNCFILVIFVLRVFRLFRLPSPMMILILTEIFSQNNSFQKYIENKMFLLFSKIHKYILINTFLSTIIAIVSLVVKFVICEDQIWNLIIIDYNFHIILVSFGKEQKYYVFLISLKLPKL